MIIKDPMKKYSFRKEERLCSIKQIQLLFSQGSSFSFHPFRIIFLKTTEDQAFPAKVVISVPKKKIKRAVDRNRIKRLIREAYRKAKSDILYPYLKEKNEKLNFIIIYSGNEIITAEETEKKLNLALERLLNKC